MERRAIDPSITRDFGLISRLRCWRTACSTAIRIAQARMYINGQRTLPFEEGGSPGYAAKIGDALASLHPTYV